MHDDEQSDRPHHDQAGIPRAGTVHPVFHVRFAQLHAYRQSQSWLLVLPDEHHLTLPMMLLRHHIPDGLRPRYTASPLLLNAGWLLKYAPSALKTACLPAYAHRPMLQSKLTADVAEWHVPLPAQNGHRPPCP